jgi:flagellar biogenesis protein FliO
MAMEGAALMSVARTLISLIGVCALAWVVLGWLSRRGIGVSQAASRLRLLGRLPLGPRRQVYLVQVDTRVFVLGAGENGPISLIAELETPALVPSAEIAGTPASASHNGG